MDGSEEEDPPPCTDQILVAVQPYRFAPAAASVLKKVSPIEQVAGNAVPAFDGLVDVAKLKSTLFP
jgi:hypothetical protein